jgi:hypothetical protein
MIAGEEPLTSQATHAPGSMLNKAIKSVNCSIGAEAPNVKDEPRRELARCVLDSVQQSVVSICTS